MKSILKVALLQIASPSADKVANLNSVSRLVAAAIKKEPDTKLIVLPECFNSPYGAEHFRKYSEVISSESTSIKALSELAKKYKVTIIGGSIPELEPSSDKLYNTSVIYDPNGKILDTHRKVHLFDVDIPNGIRFQESSILNFGNKLTTIDSDIDSLGDFKKFGVGICYDIRFPELTTLSSRQGANMMIFPAAFNLTTGPLHWHLLGRSRAVDNQMYTILCSPARATDDGYKAYGHSLVVDPFGKIIAEAGEGEEILFAELDSTLVTKARQAIPLNDQRRFDLYPDISKL